MKMEGVFAVISPVLGLLKDPSTGHDLTSIAVRIAKGANIEALAEELEIPYWRLSLLEDLVEAIVEAAKPLQPGECPQCCGTEGKHHMDCSHPR